ncbi:cAMP and cAMP-inhibited cGMP 3',5'-cyclic phosphodiesterase 10A-like [Aricia agestis]|uniref:cAMP and cAMP-inhibited cGMP 3',5'-cyclic phosphodiesterase 10A-like n=1 Tax=Aricia agestis TaxID=91739 RepID=UPI001C20A5CE|nr:cAMP and cAMP-inhibited cGMP 3',5'-cyclic phosphodiesterase 10A-like [Aricia agestis]
MSVENRKDRIKTAAMSEVLSHFLVPSEKLDRATKIVIAPYAQIERKGQKEETKSYLDMNRFTTFLDETVDLEALLYETANVLQAITSSSGVFVYIVDKVKNEIVLLTQSTKNPERHEVNIPIEDCKISAAYAAYTKENLLLDDVQKDKRFSEGLKWVDAKVALCVPIVKPDGECYAVLELYRTDPKPYDSQTLYTVVSVACWAGAAVHQTQERITLKRSSHLNNELRLLLQNYFCDLASIDTMLTDMLRLVKTFMGVMRSSFYIIDKEHTGDNILGDLWEDGFEFDDATIPHKKMKVNLSTEATPASLVAQTGEFLNVLDAYKDPRFEKEIDPITGTIVRFCLVSPIMDKTGVIGVVQLTNKKNLKPFDEDDEAVFKVFISYCSLIVHFYNLDQKKVYHESLNKIYYELMGLHLRPCKHDFDALMATHGVAVPPTSFNSHTFHISETNKEDMAGLICFMFIETFAKNFDRQVLADFVLTVLKCYRNNTYHNAEHAFSFTHTMYLILKNNAERFDFIETAGLMIAGLCHDVDHPGYNNSFLALRQHPLARMYKSSMLEHHHYYITKKIVKDKNLLGHLPEDDQSKILKEMKYNILCTDLAVYFQVRAQLTPVITEDAFDWNNAEHKKLLKGILMTTCDLSGSCKPFNIAKSNANAVYEEFYNQGDKERELGYTPLRMMDRRRRGKRAAEQLQFIAVVLQPCTLLLKALLPNTAPIAELCRKTQESWHDEIEMQGQKLWRQDESVPGGKHSSWSNRDSED